MAISTIDNSGISSTAAIDTSKLSTGAVLQVVNATNGTEQYTTSGSEVDTSITLYLVDVCAELIITSLPIDN